MVKKKAGTEIRPEQRSVLRRYAVTLILVSSTIGSAVVVGEIGRQLGEAIGRLTGKKVFLSLPANRQQARSKVNIKMSQELVMELDGLIEKIETNRSLKDIMAKIDSANEFYFEGNTEKGNLMLKKADSEFDAKIKRIKYIQARVDQIKKSKHYKNYLGHVQKRSKA